MSDKICMMMSEGYICGVGIIVKHYISSSFYHFAMFLQSPFCHDWRGWTGIVVGLLDGLGNAWGAAQLELELHVNGGGICGKR